MKETLADMASKRKEKKKAPQTSEALAANPNAPVTQADIAEVYEMVTQLLLRTNTATPTPPPPPSNLNFSYLKFQRCHLPIFEGGPDLVIVEAWIRDIENIFRALRYPDEVKLDMVIPLLRRNAEFWWSSVQGAYDQGEVRIFWGEFKRIFYEQFFPKAVRMAKEEDFMTIRQKEGMTVLEYVNKFNELGHFYPQHLSKALNL